jgi:PleD family two-component response regulator
MYINGMKKMPSILVVDDHNMMLNMVGAILEANDYSVFCALDAKDAFKILNTNSIDLIILDIVMPGIDGYQLSKKIKETPEWKEIPIVFLSSLSDTQDIVKSFEEGGVDFISKPFIKEEFLARINKRIEIKKIQDQYQLQLEELRKSNRYLMGTMHEMAKVMDETRVN